VEVSILRPAVPPTVAVTAANAPSVSPVHVTETEPAARLEVTVNVILFDAYAEVEVTEAGEVMPHKFTACAVTRPAGKDSDILLLVAWAVNGVEIVNLIVAVLSAPAALPIVSAFNSAMTPPIIGVLTKVAIVSDEVSIFKPLLSEKLAVTAAAGSTVSAVQVIITSPDDSCTNGARVNVILFDSNFDVEDVCGDDIPHELSGFAEIKPVGNVRVILFPEEGIRFVDVVNATVMDFPDPTAWLIERDPLSTAPTDGVLT